MHIDRSFLCESLSRFGPRRVIVGPKRLAAVGIVVGPDLDTVGFLLTQRAQSLKAHAGQFALPGGRLDSGEQPEDAARREIEEEVGLALDQGDVLGCLDDYETRSGFVITPVVFWADNIADAAPSPDEVALVLHIPLAALIGPAVPTLVRLPDVPTPILQMPLGGDRVLHAPTGAILHQFAQWCLRDRYISTQAFAEPSFAWT